MNSTIKTNKKNDQRALKLNVEKPNGINSNNGKFLCRYCGNDCWKTGIEKSTGKQKYRCKKCLKHQQAEYSYNAYNTNTNNNIIALTKEGVGIRATSRLLKISRKTLKSRIKKIAKETKEPALIKGKTYEIEELRTFVKKKTH